MKTIICLSGKRHSGKTTVENIIKRLAGNKATSYQMATMLKRVVAALTNCDIKDLENPKFKELKSDFLINASNGLKNLTYRELLITAGKVLRSYNDYIFVKDVLKHLDNIKEKIVIIPDVREKHEIETLNNYADVKDYYFLTIRIERPGEEIKDQFSNDKTEIDLDEYPFDVYLSNDGDMNTLIRKVYDILSSLGIIDKQIIEQFLF